MGLNTTYNLKLKLQAGDKVFGQLIGPGGEPAKTVKALQDLGDDFIMLELEHSLVNKETVFEYIRVSRELDMPLLMRTEDKAAYFRCYLDAGVNGLMLPLVHTVEEAAHAVDMSYFPPIGHRGTGIGLSPYLIDFQNLTEVPFLTLTEYINNNTVLFPQTESLENISNLPRILSLEGVTGTIVGPYDLALNIGGIDPKATGNEMVNADIVTEKLKQVVKICQGAGKIAGLGGFLPKDCAKWAKEGYQLFLLGSVLDGDVESLRPSIEEARALIG
ncbi:MAG: aldolase/citrate lyase family protein [Dehalococcoidales bacterium]